MTGMKRAIRRNNKRKNEFKKIVKEWIVNIRIGIVSVFAHDFKYFA